MRHSSAAAHLHSSGGLRYCPVAQPPGAPRPPDPDPALLSLPGAQQDELPEQSAMRIGGVDGFLPYRATATLLASALSDPPSLEECAALRTPQLDKFLPPRRQRGPAPAEQRRRIELDFAHSPIVDLGVPTPDRWAAGMDGGVGGAGAAGWGWVDNCRGLRGPARKTIGVGAVVVHSLIPYCA